MNDLVNKWTVGATVIMALFVAAVVIDELDDGSPERQACLKAVRLDSISRMVERAERDRPACIAGYQTETFGDPSWNDCGVGMTRPGMFAFYGRLYDSAPALLYSC